MPKLLRRLMRRRRRVESGRRPAHIEAFEPRLLLSADTLALGELTTARADAGALVQPLHAASPAASAPALAAPRVAIFVDAGIEQRPELLDGLLAQGGADARVYELDADRDGVEQIGEILSGLTDLAAVHVLSHGSEGSLRLGSTRLDTASLDAYAAQLASWGDALAPGGDLLLYGCDVAAGEGGIDFVGRIAAATGADVAASVDLTGAAALGGDWVLEASTGVIESAALFGAGAPAGFAEVLGGTYSGYQNGTSVVGGSLDADYDALNGEIDRIEIEDADGTLEIKFTGDEVHVVHALGSPVATLKLKGVEVVVKNSTASVSVVFEKSAAGYDGAVVDLTELGHHDVVVSFTNDSDDPDALFTGGETKQVQLEPGGAPGEYRVGVGSDRATLRGLESARFVLGRGSDVAVGSDLGERILGGQGDDALQGGGGDDEIDGGSGDDSITGGPGLNTLRGGAGSDLLVGGGERDILKGDTLTVEEVEQEPALGFLRSSDDTLLGGAGNDDLFGGAGSDLLVGGADDDALQGGPGDDVYAFEDGWGTDTVSEASGEGRDTLHFGGLTKTHLGQEIALGAVTGNLEFTLGYSAAQLFRVTDGAGNVVTADKRIEALIGGAATNTYTVLQEFADSYASDPLTNFTLNIQNALVNGVPSAILDLSQVAVALKVVIEKGTTDGENKVTVVFDPGSLTGSLGKTKIVATNVASIRTGSGNDEIVIEKGVSFAGMLRTGEGNDTITFQAGAELVGSLDGEGGNDTIAYSGTGAAHGVLEAADLAILQLLGKQAADFNIPMTVADANFPRVDGTASSIESVTGSASDDALFGDGRDNTLSGGDGADLLYGKDGADTLRGGGGDDRLDGGIGGDTLEGGAGDDTLIGGAGDDTLVGGRGDDTFQFADDWGRDTIEDQFFAFGSDTLDFSKVTEDLTWSFANSGIQVGTGAFQRATALFGDFPLLPGFEKASGTFTDPDADTLRVDGTGIGGINDNKVATIKLGVGDQTLYFGNQWSSKDIDVSAMEVTSDLVLDFSGASVPLRFTFEKVTQAMALGDGIFAGQEGRTYLIVDLLSGVTDLSLNAIGETLELGNDKIRVLVDDHTQIVSGRNENIYRTRGGSTFDGELWLLGGLRYDSFLFSETAFPSALQVGHIVDYTEKIGTDLAQTLSNLANPFFVNMQTGEVGRSPLADGGMTKSELFSQLVRSALTPTSLNPFDNELGAIDGIKQGSLKFEPGAKISGAIFPTGLNLLLGDSGNNDFATKQLRLGIHVLSGGTGADTYSFKDFWGVAAIAEVPDLNLLGEATPEALDTLDFSGFIGDIEIDVYQGGVFPGGNLTALIPGLDVSGADLLGTNVLLVNGRPLDGVLGDVIDLGGLSAGVNDTIADIQAIAGGLNNLIAFDIETIVGPQLGNLTVKLHGDAELRGTVSAGFQGTVTLDYSDYSAGDVEVNAVNSLVDLAPFDVPEALSDLLVPLQEALFGSGFGAGTTLANLAGIALPPTATAGATGILGHRLGGLTTFADTADLFGLDNDVSEVLAQFAVSGLTRVITSPQGDSIVSPQVGISVANPTADDDIRVAKGTLDLYSHGGVGDAYELDLAGQTLLRNGADSAHVESVSRVVSGKGDDLLQGTAGDEVLVLRAELDDGGALIGWGNDSVDFGGGNDELRFELPSGYSWATRTVAGGVTEFYLVDPGGAELAHTVELAPGGNVAATGAGGTWTRDASGLSTDSLVSAAPAGLAISAIPSGVLQAALAAFDGVTLLVPRVDGGPDDAFGLSVSNGVLVASNGSTVLDPASLRFQVADLPDRQLSTRLVSGEILIDATAADHGWHLDPTSAPPADRVDLVAVIVHEIARRLRLDPTIAVLQPTLAPGADGAAVPASVQRAGNAFVATPLEVTALPSYAITAVDASIDAVLDAAVAQWEAAAAAGALTVLGNSAATATIVRPSVEFVDLRDGEVARTRPDGVILLDPTAAGHGWFTDPTQAVPGDRLDLLTVVLHEMGHALGLGHDLVPGAADLLDEKLDPGVRLGIPALDLEVVSLESSDQSKLSTGLEAFRDWVFGLGARVDELLSIGTDVPFLGDLFDLRGLLGLDSDAGSQFATRLQQAVIDPVLALFGGAGPITSESIASIAGIELAPSSNAAAYRARVDISSFASQLSLDPSQLQLAGLDPSDLGLSVTSAVVPTLDVTTGVALEFDFGLDASGRFYVQAPGVALRFAVTDGGNPFDVTIDLGPFGFGIDDGTVDIHGGMRLGTSERLDYQALVRNELDPGSLIPVLDGGAEWNIVLPLVLTGSLAGVNADGLEIRAQGSIDGGIGSLETLLSRIEFETPGMDDILGMVTLSPDLVLDLAIAALDALAGDDSIINQDIPGVGQSIADLLGDGTNDFLTGLKQSLESLRGTDIGSLATGLNDAISDFLGVAVEPFAIRYEHSTLSVDFDLDYALAPGTTVGFGLDLDPYRDELGLNDLAELANVDISITDPSVLLGVEGSIGVALGFGIDLSNLLDIQSYISADSGIALDLSASTAAPVDFGVDVQLGPARVGFLIDDATASLSATGRFGLAPNGDGRYSISGAGIAGLQTEFTLDGRASLDLPIFFPTAQYPLNGTTADTDGDGFGQNVLHFGAEIEGGRFAFATNAPNLGDLFGLAALLNDPGTLLRGLEGMFEQIKSAMQGNLAGIELPFIADALKDKASVIDDLRVRALGATDGALFADGGHYTDASSLGGRLEALDDAGGSVFEEIVDLVQTALFDALGGPGGPLKVAVTVDGNRVYDPATGQVQLRDVLSKDDIGIEFDGSSISFNVLLGDSLVSESIPFNFDAAAPGFELSTEDAAVLLNIAYVFGLGFGFDARDKFFLDTRGATEQGAEFALDVSATLGDDAVVTARLGFLQATLKEMFHSDPDRLQDLAEEFGVAPDADGHSGLFAGISFDLTDGNGNGRWTIDESLDASANLFAKANVDLGGRIELPDSGPITLPEISSVLRYDQTFADVTVGTGGSSATLGEAPTLRFSNVTLDVGTAISGFLGPIANELASFIGPDTTLIQLLDMLTTEIDIGVAKFSLLANDFSDPNKPVIGFLESFAEKAADKEKVRKTADAIKQILAFSDVIGAIEAVQGESIMVSFGDFTVGGSTLTQGTSNTGPAQELSPDEYEGGQEPDLDQATQGSKSNDVVQEFTKPGSIRVPLLTNPASVLGLLLGRRTDLFIYDLPSLALSVAATKSFPVFPGLNARIGGSVEITSALSFGFDTTGFELWSAEDFALGELDQLFKGFYFGDWDENGVERPELTLQAGLRAGASVGVSGLVEAGVEGGVVAEVDLDLADIPDPITEQGDGRLYFDEIGLRLAQGIECLFELHGELRAFLEAFFWVGVDAGFFEITIFEARQRFVDQVLASFDFECPPPSLDVAHLASDGTLTVRAIDADGAQIDSADRGGYAAQAERYSISLVNADFTVGPDDDGIDNPVDRIQVVGNGSFEYFDPAEVQRIVVLGTEFDDSYEIDDDVLADVEIHGLGGNDRIEVAARSDAYTRTIFAGEGNDTILGSLFADEIHGGGGRDVIMGNGGADFLYGDADDDFLMGGDDVDHLFGGSGNDQLAGGGGGDTLEGGTGNDQLLGEAGNDLLYGVSATEFANAEEGNARNRDLLSGGDGDDTIVGGDGDDTIIGGRSGFAGDVLAGRDGADSFLWTAGDGFDRVYGDDVTSDPTANGFDDKASLIAYGTDSAGLPSDPATDDVVAVSANGPDVHVDWNGTNLELHGLHSVDLDTGDGGDTVSVGELRGTTLAHAFPLLDAAGDPILFGNLNIALGSSRTVVSEDRPALDSEGNPDLDENGDPIVESFDIVEKADDAHVDVLEIRGEGGVDAFRLTDFADFDPENGNPIARMRIEQAGGITVNVQELGFADDRVVVDAGDGADTIDASGLATDLVDDLRLIGGSGDDRLIGSGFSELIVGGLGADRVTGNAGVDVFFSAEYPEPATEGDPADPVVDTLIEQRDADFALSDDAITIGGESEVLAGYFEAVELRGGDSSNRFELDAFTGSGVLDGGEGGDNYQVRVAQAAVGTTFLNIDDSGTNGIDELLYLGSDGNDLLQLDTVYIAALDPTGEFSSDRYAGYGSHGDGLLVVHFGSDADAFQRADLDDEDALTGLETAALAQGAAFQVLNYSTVEENRVFAGEGDDKIISDDTAQNLSVYGNAGDDEFYVGSVLGTETVLVEGREVTVVTDLTRGNSFLLNLYGGEDDDYFQVNHNAADLNLFGDNGDDTFFIRALLALDENEDVVEVENKLARVSGVTGEGSEESQRNDDTRAVDIDSLVYVENANVAIDGGAGFDSVAIVGTVLSDTFYVFTEIEDGEVVQRIFGAGVKLRELLNVERLQLITGAGDDRVFVYGVDLGPVADLVISTGTGSDTVEFGGPERTIELTFPRRRATEFASVDGFEPGAEIPVNFGLGIGQIDNPARVVPFVVDEPAQTRTRTIAAARTIAGIRSPVIVRDVDGIRDTVVFHNEDGPTDLVFEDRELLRKAIETDSARVVYPTTPREGTTTDLIAELGSLGAGAAQVVETVNDYLENLVLFTDRYFDPALIERLAALSGDETESVEISAGVSYAVFQDTLDADGNFVTARAQLDAFLDGTGFAASYTTSPHPDPSQTVPLFDIASISNGAGRELAFEAQYREFVLDGVTLRDLIGVSLVTAGPVDVEVQGGWVTPGSVAVVDSDVFDSVYVQGSAPTVFFGGQEELSVFLNESSDSSLRLDDDVFEGLVEAYGGAGSDLFDIRSISGQSFLHGGEGDDDFLVREGFVEQIAANLFLLGEGGSDDVIVHAEDLDGGVDVLFDRDVVQHEEEFRRLSRVTNALEFTNLSDEENDAIQAELESDSVPFAKLAAMVDVADLLQVVTQGSEEAATAIREALLGSVEGFSAAIDTLVADQRAGFVEFLTGAIQSYVDARNAIASSQATITKLEKQLGPANDILDVLFTFFDDDFVLDLVGGGGSLSGFSSVIAGYFRDAISLRKKLQAAEADLQAATLRRDGAIEVLSPYVSSADLSARFSDLKSKFAQTAGALISTSTAATLELESIEAEVRDAGQATLDALADATALADALLAADADPTDEIAAMLSGLDALRAHLEQDETGLRARFVRVERLALVKDVILAAQRAQLEDVAALFAAIPDASAFDTSAFLGAPTFASGVALFDSPDFQSVLAAYDQARDIARGFVNFRSVTYANLRSVTLNADRFQVFADELVGGFDFAAFKASYEANVAELLASLDLYDDLAVESRLIAQLASLERDLARVDAVVVQNDAVTEVFSQLLADATGKRASVSNLLQGLYDVTLSFWRFTASVVLGFTNDYRYVAANSEVSARAVDLSRAETLAQDALHDQADVQGQVDSLRGELEALQAGIETERDRLNELNAELAAQYQFLRGLSATAVSVLATTRAETAAAEFSDTSSLISEILEYTESTVVGDAPGVESAVDEFLPGPTGNSVIEHVDRKDFFEVLTLSGLNAGNIHAGYDDVETFSLFTGDGADQVRIHDSLGQAGSTVFVSTGAGDDFLHVANAADSVDDVVGDLVLDADGGSNRLLIDDVGDATGDAIVQRYANGYVQLVGMADGDISYRALGGDFGQGLDIVTSSGDDDVTLRALHGDDHTMLFTGTGADVVTIEDFPVDPGADLTIFTQTGDDQVLGDAAPLGFTAHGDGGDDLLRGGAFGDVLLGEADDDVVVGNGGPDSIVGDSGNDTLIGDGGQVTLSNGIVMQIDAGPTAGAAALLLGPLPGTDSIDWIQGGVGEDVLIGGGDGDFLDGGMGDDLIFGDAASLSRRVGVIANPRFQALLGSVIYDRTDLGPELLGAPVPASGEESGKLLVDGQARAYRDRDGSVPDWAEYEILDLFHTRAIEESADGSFGDDRIAGGAGDDVIFGQLGDDLIEGDGEIDAAAAALHDADGAITPSEAATDGDDYIEGGGGRDTIWGDLGQDDIIGGSSSLFSLDTREERPDDSDTLYGGAGTRGDLNHLLDDANRGAIDLALRHARDSDVIAGDNANIIRIVGTNGTDGGGLIAYQYDQDGPDQARGPQRIVVRGVELLDYTPGGPDFEPDRFDPGHADFAPDLGARDLIHGESGDDILYGMTGDDALFGDSEDDDLVGGWGNDWISGGTGTDGVIGDDGRISTGRYLALGSAPDPSRPGDYAELLLGVLKVEQINQEISTPGNIQVAMIHQNDPSDPTDGLFKTVDLTPFNLTPRALGVDDPYFDPLHADDILYGGLGDDFLHGGAGDDAISGAEALPEFYANPVNPGDVLGFDPTRIEFAAYDEEFPRLRIDGFLLNFDNDQRGQSDEDALFGDLGNDWLVGGRDNDHLYGGFGADLLDADDDKTTNGGLNDGPDPVDYDNQDFAFGGAGRDVLNANTGGDRLIDWAGEFNSYLTPFAPFGLFTVSRGVPPHLFEFLYQLARADGVDPTRSADTGKDAARLGEPEGEIGLVTQKDPAWHDQTGAPIDPQPGNIPGGPRLTLRGVDFNDASNDGFSPDSGSFTVAQGRLEITQSGPAADIDADGYVANSDFVALRNTFGNASPAADIDHSGWVDNADLRTLRKQFGDGPLDDAVSVLHVGEYLPAYFEIEATINAAKPTGGAKSNAYLVFDYQGPEDFKFAGVNISTDKIEMGYRDATGWHVIAQSNAQLRPDRDYRLLLALNGVTATLVVDGQDFFSHAFAPRIDEDGFTYGLNAGMVGLGAYRSAARIDDVAVKVLRPEITFSQTDDFSDGTAPGFGGVQIGAWAFEAARLVGTGVPGGAALDGFALDVGPNSVLTLEATLGADSLGGFYFDSYGTDEYKFAGVRADTGEVVIGHLGRGGAVVVDAVAPIPFAAGPDFDLRVSLKGTTASVSVDGHEIVGHVFNAVVVDGAFGLLASGGAASFDRTTIATDDPAYMDPIGEALHAASLAPAGRDAAALVGADLVPIVSEAIRRWQEALGSDLGGVTALSDVDFRIADLDGTTLGLASERTVWLDANAAGYGWFVDASPGEDSEFRRPGSDGERLATPSSPAADRIDLLSVVVHELGHVLGLDSHALLGTTLDAGERVLPAAREEAPRSVHPRALDYAIRVLAATQWSHDEDDDADVYAIREIELDGPRA